MKECSNCYLRNSTQEYLTEFEDGGIRAFTFCSRCQLFGTWVKLDNSIVVRDILRKHLNEHKLDRTKLSVE